MANVTIVNQPAQVQTVSGIGQQSSSDGARQSTLAQGSVVSGTIIGKDASGNFVLRTASDGNISLHSPTPLTYNSDVELRIGANNAGGTTARILTVNGQPFETTPQQAEPESDTVSDTLLAQASQSTPAGASQTQATATQTVRAVVVPAPAAPPAPAPANAGSTSPQNTATSDNGVPNSATLNSGDNVILHVQAQESPAATAQENESAPPPVTTSEQATAAPQPNVSQQWPARTL